MNKELIEKIKKKKRLIPVIIVAIAAIVYFLIVDRESIFVGTIEVTGVDVAPRVASQIAERLVDEGDEVKVGDVMYKLTCEQTMVDGDKASKDYERAKKLLASGNMPPEQYDKFKKEYDNAMYNVNWCVVRAPINGTVLTKFHEAGDYVNIGTKLMAMGDLNDVWAYVYLDQPLLAKISLGEEVTGILPELGSKKIKGWIIRLKNEAEFTPKNVQTRKERTRLVYGIKVKFDNSEKILKPGMPIEVRFPNINE